MNLLPMILDLTQGPDVLPKPTKRLKVAIHLAIAFAPDNPPPGTVPIHSALVKMLAKCVSHGAVPSRPLCRYGTVALIPGFETMSGHAALELDQVVALRGSHASDTRRRLDHVGCTWANTRTSRYTVVQVVQVEFDRCWDCVVFKYQSRRGTFQVRKHRI